MFNMRAPSSTFSRVSPSSLPISSRDCQLNIPETFFHYPIYLSGLWLAIKLKIMSHSSDRDSYANILLTDLHILVIASNASGCWANPRFLRGAITCLFCKVHFEYASWLQHLQYIVFFIWKYFVLCSDCPTRAAMDRSVGSTPMIEPIMSVDVYI